MMQRQIIYEFNEIHSSSKKTFPIFFSSLIYFYGFDFGICWNSLLSFIGLPKI